MNLTGSACNCVLPFLFILQKPQDADREKETLNPHSTGRHNKPRETLSWKCSMEQGVKKLHQSRMEDLKNKTSNMSPWQQSMKLGAQKLRDRRMLAMRMKDSSLLGIRECEGGKGWYRQKHVCYSSISKKGDHQQFLHLLISDRVAALLFIIVYLLFLDALAWALMVECLHLISGAILKGVYLKNIETNEQLHDYLVDSDLTSPQELEKKATNGPEQG
ncbi:uncharacterized protein [Pleurodeles waltl]|uniref:uncharacterized protein n=1 Tax=Pleurodeles waltl TaxID=8319 RepID=UPI0037093D6A